MVFATDLRNGTVFKYEGRVWIVLNFEFIKMGRGSGTVKVKVRDLRSGAIVEKGFSQQMKFEEAEVHKKSAQYLYKDETHAFFMDLSTFDQFKIDLESIKEFIKYVPEGGKVIVVYLDSEPITIEVPKSVSLKVTYTENAVRGDTTANAMKKAILESGIEVNVPLFIEVGDVIKVNTETGEYVERVNK